MTCQENLLSAENPSPPPRSRWLILFFILILAAFLRLVKLGQISPPGLNQDEAANAWSAYCLLKTGKDYSGAHWPIYYVRNLGGNSTSLYVYLLLPFQAIGGLNIYTAHLPAAVLGIFTVFVIYLVGKKLFDENTGLAAAALLALNPWHLHESRWGHEASIAPLLGLAPLALMLWAGLPVSDDKTASPRPIIAAVAGALTGIGCYGYHSVRLFVPAFLFVAVLFTLPAWLQTLKTRKGILAAAAFIIAFFAFFGPLAWQHIFHPEGIGRHALYQQGWVGSVPLSTAIKNVAVRYARHFSPYSYNCYTTPRYMLPLMTAGLIILFVKFKPALSARALLAFVLTYPIGDSLGWGLNVYKVYSLRSSPGLCSLILLGAVGAVGAFKWLRGKNHLAASALTAILVITMAVSHTSHLRYFYGGLNRQPEIYHDYNTDLVEACRWLQPRFNDFDAVFCTTKGFNMPYVITTVALGYDPKKWFSDGFDFTTHGEFDIYTRYGKMYFMYDEFFKPPVEKTYPPGRTLFIVRPGELNFESISAQLVHKIIGPDGEIALLLYQV